MVRDNASHHNEHFVFIRLINTAVDITYYVQTYYTHFVVFLDYFFSEKQIPLSLYVIR